MFVQCAAARGGGLLAANASSLFLFYPALKASATCAFCQQLTSQHCCGCRVGSSLLQGQWDQRGQDCAGDSHQADAQ